MMRKKITALALSAFLAAGCAGPGKDEAVPAKDIMAVVDERAPELMAISGVTAVAVGRLESGESCIRVYVREMSDELREKIPATLEGHPVDVEVSGEIRPLGAD